MDNLIALIRERAADKMHMEDSFDPGDGGNYDDAYYMGSDDGEIAFARELLRLIDDAR